MVEKAPSTSAGKRQVVYRTRGMSHGPITRLMSPGDLGHYMKPFVFLDLFSGSTLLRKGGMGLHPHSGIGTVTVVTDGDMTFDDPVDGHGTIGFGGVEWMRAGGGVWHGKELSPGTSDSTTGYQLWVALPPELENTPPQSQYLEASAIPEIGPSRIILGQVDGVQSPVRSPGGINYLLVRLAPDETWTYSPPEGHLVGWLSIASGSLRGEYVGEAGEMLLFDQTDRAIALTAGADGVTFVLGSAIPHPHDLVLGSHSVHTSPDALQKGERQIRELRVRMMEQERAGAQVSAAPFTGS